MAYNVKQRISAGESIEGRGGAVPKRRLNKGDRISLSLNIKNNSQISLRTMQSSLNFSRIDVSYSTVRRCIKGMSYSRKTAIKGPNITPSHETLRILWAKKHKFINWRNKVLFTDECSICLCGGKGQLWTKGTQKHVINIPRHSP